VSPSAIEAPLTAQRLGHWGAATRLVPDAAAARATLREQHWDAVLIDRALGLDTVSALARAADVPRRIVLLTPAERHELGRLKDAGFTGYLVKPLRAASLAARFTDASPAMTDDRPEDGARNTGQGLAILVAEDNEINALLARALLTRLGHRATIVENGAAALDAYLAAAHGALYDCILMDVNMPGMDGLEATRRIRAAEAESGAAHTPIVALTANAFGEDREACLAAGMDDFLVKPLDREKLADVLSRDGRSATLAA
jgi:CheY-like chemotaxis protein